MFIRRKLISLMQSPLKPMEWYQWVWIHYTRTAVLDYGLQNNMDRGNDQQNWKGCFFQSVTNFLLHNLRVFCLFACFVKKQFNYLNILALFSKRTVSHSELSSAANLGQGLSAACTVRGANQDVLNELVFHCLSTGQPEALWMETPPAIVSYSL